MISYLSKKKAFGLFLKDSITDSGYFVRFWLFANYVLVIELADKPTRSGNTTIENSNKIISYWNDHDIERFYYHFLMIVSLIYWKRIAQSNSLPFLKVILALFLPIWMESILVLLLLILLIAVPLKLLGDSWLILGGYIIITLFFVWFNWSFKKVIRLKEELK